MLNNMKGFFSASMCTLTNNNVTCKNLVGDTISMNIASSSRSLMDYSIIRFSEGNTNGVMFGTSNDPVTEDDYCLHGTVLTTADIKVLTPSLQVLPTITDEFIGFIVAYTITAKKDVTIGEMGVAFTAVGNPTASTSAMMDRVVFEQPIVMQQGETKTITYRMKIG